MPTAVEDFKVADLGLADFGRKEIVLTEGDFASNLILRLDPAGECG